MFLMIGISPYEKKLMENRPSLCPCCGRLGKIEVFMTAMEVTFFMLPIFRWNRRYFAKTICCKQTSFIPREQAKQLLLENNLDVSSLSWPVQQAKRCCFCGFTTKEEFLYCPKCGQKL